VSVSGALFGAFCIFAVLDWIAVGQQVKPLEYFAKPAALAALLVWAACGTPSPWLIAALFCSLVGDVLLMLPVDAFVGGLLAFLLGHVAYVLAFHPPAVRSALWMLVIVAVLSPIAVRIIGAVHERPLRGAVALYSLVISAMVAAAMCSGRPLAIAGALLFLASDMLIAWTRFVGAKAWGPVAIIVTYHVGQAALAAALRAG